MSVSRVRRATRTRRPSRSWTSSVPSGVVMRAVSGRGAAGGSGSISQAASMSRSFSSGSRTVTRRQWASGWPCPNVRGTRPRRHSASAAASDRSARPEVEQQEVGHARLRVPARRRRARRRGAGRSASHAGDVRLHVARRRASALGDDGGRDRADRARRPVRARCGAIVAAVADREPDPQAGHRVRLATPCGPTTTFGYRSRSGMTDASDELAVRLVDDDRRGGPAVGGGVRGDALEEALDRAVGLRAAGRVVRVADPDEVTSPRAAAARTAWTSIAQPSAFEPARDRR